MRIGIDGRVFIGNKTGIGRYVSELCVALDSVLPDALFYVYCRKPMPLPVNKANWILRTESSAFRKTVRNFLWFKLFSGLMSRKDRIDVYWGAGSFLPLFLKPVKSLMTVYNLVHVIAPQTMYRFNLWMFRIFFKRDTRKADRITAISKGTAKRLKDLYGHGVDAIVYPSTADRFVPQAKEAITLLTNRYGITQPYFLSVATWEPRKNLRLLLETYLSMKRQGEIGDYQLVLAGGRGWKDKKLTDIVEGDHEDSGVIPLGYVSDEDMATLYSGAAAFLFPSLYEGFGIPVLEARKCGIPVIASDIPEIREAGGDGCIYIPPTAEGIRSGILRFLKTSRQVSQAEVLNPSWEEGALKMVRIFKEAAYS